MILNGFMFLTFLVRKIIAVKKKSGNFTCEVEIGFFKVFKFAFGFSVYIRAAREGLNARNDAPGHTERDLKFFGS